MITIADNGAWGDLADDINSNFTDTVQKISVNTVATAGDLTIPVALPTGFEHFDIRVTGKMGPSNSALSLRISEDSGVTYKAGASDYKSSDSNSASVISLSDGQTVGSARTVLFKGGIHLSDAGTDKFIVVGDFFSSQSTGTFIAVNASGFRQLDVVVTHLQVIVGAGDADDLVVTLWGRK